MDQGRRERERERERENQGSARVCGGVKIFFRTSPNSGPICEVRVCVICMRVFWRSCVLCVCMCMREKMRIKRRSHEIIRSLRRVFACDRSHEMTWHFLPSDSQRTSARDPAFKKRFQNTLQISINGNKLRFHHTSTSCSGV